MTPLRTALSSGLALVLIALFMGATQAAPPPRIDLTGPASATPGETAVLNAVVTRSSAAGEPAVLEQDLPGGWQAVQTGTLDASSRTSFTVTAGPVGTQIYRVRIPETSRHKTVTSDAHTLTVVAAPEPTPDPSPEPTPEPTPAGFDCGGATPVKENGDPWVCTYNDEFDGTSLDRDYWVPQVTATSRVITGTESLYTCYDDRSDVIAVREGNLELSMTRLPEAVDCGQGFSSRYVAGQVSHFGTFSQTYGKYEVRAKLPAVRERGLQQTFWLWPDNQFEYGAWPASGEIDFAEFYSRYPDLVVPYMHYLAGPTIMPNQNVVTAYDCAIDFGEYNTYGLEWKPKQLKIFVNGELCIENNYMALNGLLNPTVPFDHPFFLALTQAMGTTGNEYDPAVMPATVTTKVDYARIWK